MTSFLPLLKHRSNTPAYCTFHLNVNTSCYFLTDLMNWVGCSCPDHGRNSTFVASAPWKCGFRGDKPHRRRESRSRCWRTGFQMCHNDVVGSPQPKTTYTSNGCSVYSSSLILCFDSLAFPRQPTMQVSLISSQWRDEENRGVFISLKERCWNRQQNTTTGNKSVSAKGHCAGGPPQDRVINPEGWLWIKEATFMGSPLMTRLFV